jgi:hypothetical protein
MSSEQEMKRVMEHAATLLGARIQRSHTAQYEADKMNRADMAAMSYAKAVLDLLGAYITLGETPEPAPEQPKAIVAAPVEGHGLVRTADGWACYCGEFLGTTRMIARDVLRQHRRAEDETPADELDPQGR